MSEVLDDLVDLLSLEAIEANLFRGRSQDLGFRQLFGGQVLGQSLSAASQTVEPARHVHSLHGYFLRPGDAALAVMYRVDPVRDGGSFSTRRVTAVQKGETIFTGSMSFHRDEEGFHHQAPMPQVVGPENLPTELELLKQQEQLIPGPLREKLLCPKPIEIRPVTERDPYNPQRSDPVKYVWFRADGKLAANPSLHRWIMAYASDFNLLTTALLPHAKSAWHRDMQIASLDHALWFHGNLVADDWLLYALDSPWAGNARGFCRGSVYNRAGQLVASSAQEGLMRYRKDWA
ncbi:acyl-CoA thioesterase [Pseudomonas typographi]|uniref:Acyl-CoA thioesterase II n=1 Tax=Pseudomonas typographi TaxID=2715964 RepID=A0ABR7Z6H0_9PSED|nr:acyl-CoA thioesterase II [Pseudomonas typographi]MBD1553518.1 acyl-CoA thioesterase II [Pseudomonas typographi]MBD1588945.1 acyl-CoA thioesterase II [Pseudomonas typographi]MBD1600992.1 acyl-CoA thioesterase II [Pseudomonas typographi]